MFNMICKVNKKIYNQIHDSPVKGQLYYAGNGLRPEY